MAQAVLAIATAPKSNSVVAAIDQAMEYVNKHQPGQVPLHLRDAHYPGAKNFSHGLGYLYPHSFPGHWVNQDYLPPEAKGFKFYEPPGTGADKNRGIPELIEAKE
jgi:putative ATPase